MACKEPRRHKMSFEKEHTWKTFRLLDCDSKTVTLWLKNTQINFSRKFRNKPTTIPSTDFQ